MSKSIQSSFAGRIGKAETLYSTLIGFTDYNPGDDSLKPDGIRITIDKLYGYSKHTPNASMPLLPLSRPGRTSLPVQRRWPKP